MTLTGRTRYRVGWRGRLVLQVEYHYVSVTDLNGSGYYDRFDTFKWRDARVEDVAEIPTILQPGYRPTTKESET